MDESLDTGSGHLLLRGTRGRMWSCLLSPSLSPFLGKGGGSVEEKGIEDNYLLSPTLLRQGGSCPPTP